MNVLLLIDQTLAAGGLLLLALAGRRVARSPIDGPVPPPPVNEQFLALCILAYFGTAMLLSAAMKSLVPGDEILQAMVINNGAQLAGVAACLILAARGVPGRIPGFLFGADSSDRPREPSRLLEALIVGVIAIGVCPLIRDATVWLVQWARPDMTFAPHPTLDALSDGSLSPARVGILWLGAAVIAPTAEEIFFRGALQNFLHRQAGSYAAIGLSALAFAMVHFTQPHALPALFFLGLLLGFSYARSQSLTIPILVHAAFNLKTLVWESLLRAA